MTEETFSIHYGATRSPSPTFSERLGDAAKRVFDILASCFGLLLLLPFFAIIAVRIKRDSPGPVFYHGQRTGRGGKPFSILKFRTMYESPESYQGPRLTAEGDPRVTPLGRWLRDTKINELPQLWNVLLGHMSLVGPRPEDPEIAQTWPREVRSEILSVRPGITSPASVLYRQEEAKLANGSLMETYLEDVQPSKLRLDQIYIRHRSLSVDLDVLFLTLAMLLPLLRKVDPPEEVFFWGPLARLFERHLNWFVIDAAGTLFAFGITGLLWRMSRPLDIGLGQAFLVSLGFSMLFSLSCAVTGMQRVEWSKAPALDAAGLILPFTIGCLTAIGFEVLLGPQSRLPIGLIIMGSCFSLGMSILVRYRSRILTGLAQRWISRRQLLEGAQERVLIVGSGDAGQFLSWMLHNSRSAQRFYVAGFVDDDFKKQKMLIQDVRVVGRTADLPTLVEKYDIGLILFAIHNIDARARRKLLQECQKAAAKTNARVVSVPDILGALRASVEHKVAPAIPDPDMVPAWQEGKLACQYCLAHASPIETENFLARVAQQIECGDLEGARREIARARQSIVLPLETGD